MSVGVTPLENHDEERLSSEAGNVQKSMKFRIEGIA